MEKPNTTTIYARIPAKLKRQVDEYAASNGMTLAGAVSVLLRKGLAASGNAAMGYIYCPDRVASDNDISCSRCGEEAIFSSLGRRESVETWIEVLSKHRNCTPREASE